MSKNPDWHSEQMVQRGIRNLEVKKNDAGSITSLSFAFGPHFFVDVVEEQGKVSFTLGVTHHGMTFDASEVGGELEKAMNVMSRAGQPDSIS